MAAHHQPNFSNIQLSEPDPIELQYVTDRATIHSNSSQHSLANINRQSSKDRASTDIDAQKEDNEGYAHGFILFTVVLALVLSMFLASLDMVSLTL